MFTNVSHSKFLALIDDTGSISLEKEDSDQDVTEEQVFEAFKAGKEDLAVTCQFDIYCKVQKHS